MHVLFKYRFARDVWDLTGLWKIVERLLGENMFQIFHRVFTTGTTEQCVPVHYLARACGTGEINESGIMLIPLCLGFEIRLLICLMTGDEKMKWR